MKQWWRYIVVMMVTILSACSSLNTQVEQSRTTLSATTQMHRMGRFAVLVFDKTEGKNKDSVQGNFDWVSHREKVTLDLSSPLGQVLARVEVQPGFSRLLKSNGEVFEAESPDVLVQDVLGREFPVSGLQYWIHGLEIPGVPLKNAEYDQQKRLTKFTQAGWTVIAQDYDQYGPKRFQLLNNQVTERISIRIIME